MTAADVDWEALRVEAVRMTTLAYCPYSEFPVGVAGWVDDGRMVSGCNVENAGTASRSAPSAAWCRRCTRPVAAG